MGYADAEKVCLRFNTELLSAEFSETDEYLLVSLDPRESVSVCASKLKGQLGKSLRIAIGESAPPTLLGRGYFACTSGNSDRREVERGLPTTAGRHRCIVSAKPPVFAATYAISPADQRRLSPAHAHTILNFNVVLATRDTEGLFRERDGRAIAARWRTVGRELGFALHKVSFVPDHVHATLRSHPKLSPASFVVAMMNTAQDMLVEQAGGAIVHTAAQRVWQPSAYIESFGDLTTGKIRTHLRKWSDEQHEEA